MGVKILNKQEVGNREVNPLPVNLDVGKLCLILVIISWVLFILVLLIISYFPPPEPANHSVIFLCEGLKFFAYSTTGSVLGYVGAYFPNPVKKR